MTEERTTAEKVWFEEQMHLCEAAQRLEIDESTI